MAPPPVLPDLFGLVLVGGQSRRMGTDKALLRYRDDRPQALVVYQLLGQVCDRVYLSTRQNQATLPSLADLPRIEDQVADLGPIGGILSALATHPDRAWLVVACDLPRLNPAVLQHLVRHRSTESLAVAYRSAYDGQPEPLCAVYEPAIAPLLRRYVADAGRCPRRALADLAVPLLDLPDDRALDNINAPAEFEAAREELAGQ